MGGNSSSILKRANFAPSAVDPSDIGVLRLHDEREYQSSDESPHASKVKPRIRKPPQVTRIAHKKKKKLDNATMELPESEIHENSNEALNTDSLSLDAYSTGKKTWYRSTSTAGEDEAFPDDSGEIVPEKIKIGMFTQMIPVNFESRGGHNLSASMPNEPPQYAFPQEETASELDRKETRTKKSFEDASPQSNDTFSSQFDSSERYRRSPSSRISTSLPSEADDDGVQSISHASLSSVTINSRNSRKNRYKDFFSELDAFHIEESNRRG
jgi:hypothetical protein